MTRPILYSFRRCPYAMRARLALVSSGVRVELREVVLRDKAAEFLAVSPSATVPALDLGATSIDESYDIMLWALDRSDPEGLLNMPGVGFDLIEEADGPFKTALDRYKYASRHADVEIDAERDKAGVLLYKLDEIMGEQAFLFGAQPTLADLAILPFVRQFAHVDLAWFHAQNWHSVSRWVEAFKASDRFISIMDKYPRWTAGDRATLFP